MDSSAHNHLPDMSRFNKAMLTDKIREQVAVGAMPCQAASAALGVVPYGNRMELGDSGVIRRIAINQRYYASRKRLLASEFAPSNFNANLH